MEPDGRAAEARGEAGKTVDKTVGETVAKRRRRLPRRWLAIVVAGLLAVLVSASGIAGTVAAQRLERVVVAHFSAAQAHLERARTLLSQASGAHAQASLDQARLEFQRAQVEFRAAGNAVTGSPAHLVPAAAPLAGGRVAAVEHLSAMGLALCDAGLRSVDIDADFLKPAAAGQPAGTAHLLTILSGVQATLPALRGDFDRAHDEVSAIDPSVVPASQRPAFEKARADIDKGIAGIAELGRLVPAIGEILGVNGRRTYVVEQVNPFELRAGGGYIGTFSLLMADRGSLSVLRSGDTHELPDFSTVSGQTGYVAPPAAMRGLLGQKSWSFEDTNFYPDFRDDARAAAQFAQRDFGTALDGVISIDLYAVAALLGVTGPVAVPGYGATLTKDNAISTIMAGDLIDDPAHKRVISSVAGPLMQRLVTLDSGQWLGVIQVLNQLATQRHLQLFFASDAAQSEMQRLGLAGDLVVAGHPDFVDLGEANFGGNKANYFLTRTLQLALSRSGDSLHHVLTEDLRLDLGRAPAGYVVPYSFFGRLLVPAGATGLQLAGLARSEQPSMTPPAGVGLLEGAGSIQPGQPGHTGSLRVTYTWDTPWSEDASGAHAIYWQKQPGVAQDAITVTWTDGGATASAKSDLSTDRVLQLGPGAKVTITPGNAAQVSLPRL